MSELQPSGSTRPRRLAEERRLVGLASAAGGSSLAGTMLSSKGISIPKAERKSEPSALSAAPGKSAGNSVLGDFDGTLLLGGGSFFPVARFFAGVTAPLRFEGVGFEGVGFEGVGFEGAGFLLAAAGRVSFGRSHCDEASTPGRK